jgi:predicted RecA/RadA family phage recombinase
MTSPDGITWTTRTSASNKGWKSVTYGSSNGLFVAVSDSNSGSDVMTSPDGINWTLRTTPTGAWQSVTQGNGIYAAVSSLAGTVNTVMTSLDGITWTLQTATTTNGWNSITYGSNALFVAVANSGTGNRVMTSPDAVTWTTRTSASNDTWKSVTYGNSTYVAVSSTSTSAQSVMTSSDGIAWTLQTATTSNGWTSVVYGNNLFTAVAATGTGNRVMTSSDGITWTPRSSAADNNWSSVVYGEGIFVAVANTGVSNRVMVSANSATPTLVQGSNKVTINYTNASDVDFATTLVLRSLSAVVAVPTDGTVYATGTGIGASTVVCADNGSANAVNSCIDSGLVNGTAYHYAVFAVDTYGNYGTGIVPSGSPMTPNSLASAVTVNSYRLRKDDGGETSSFTDYAENTPISSNFITGDKIRARFAISNQGVASTTKAYQIEYSGDGGSTWIPVPRALDAKGEHWRVEPSDYVAHDTVTTHSSSITIPGGKSFKSGRVQTLSRVTSPITLASTEFTEIEFSLRSTGYASPDGNYSFRLTNQGESSDFTYTNIPSIVPRSHIFRYYGGGGGGGSASAVVEIEAPSAVASTTTTGGNASSTESGNGGEVYIPPAPTQSTTSPQRNGGGGGGDVGYLMLPNNPLYTYNSNRSPLYPQGIVLGVSTGPFCTNLRYHMDIGSTDRETSDQVSELQFFLQRTGYFEGKVNGYFGESTKEALSGFQKSHNLIVTGVAGKVTRVKMRSVGCRG